MIYKLEKTLESPLDFKEIQPVCPKGSVLGVHWKDWWWSWNSSTLANSGEELTHWKKNWTELTSCLPQSIFLLLLITQSPFLCNLYLCLPLLSDDFLSFSTTFFLFFFCFSLNIGDYCFHTVSSFPWNLSWGGNLWVNLSMLRYKWMNGFPGGTSDKEAACSLPAMWESRFNPQVRKIPWNRRWQPNPVFLPGKSHNGRAWLAIVHEVTKSTSWLSK